ncbi:hypothetical protein BRADI_2g00443v3 [Brachypodium distachyon]|uniref:F-box domain-containing protein n=1 Tax=Brachypodium distachyon TaxID=15368 RepID=A0A0Q3MD68_BRADI|nr:hypothetical protein BRADI_2g00443v3 [Brachypodium distachyon]
MAAAAAELHDELLLDIFSRLPDPIDLLRCAATCARWFRLILDLHPYAAGNANLGLQLHRSSSVLGAFYHNNDKLSLPPKFVRLHAPTRPAGSCFFPSSEDGILSSYSAKPLASRRGLPLSRLLPTPQDQRKLHLAVSHPLLGGRARVLPPPPFDLDPELHRELTGYALLLTDAGAPIDIEYCQSLAMSGPRAGTVDDAHGTAHWLYRDASSLYILAVTGDATRAALTKLPFIPPLQRHLQQQQQQTLFPCVTRGGDLALFFHSTGVGGGGLHLWKTADHGRSWVRSELQRAPLPSDRLFKVVGFAESAGKLLVCSVDRLWTLWWLDVESGETETAGASGRRGCYYPTEVCRWSCTCQGYDSCSECTYNCRVLYEVHCPSFLGHMAAWSQLEPIF